MEGQRISEARNFGRACLLASRAYRQEAQRLQDESEAGDPESRAEEAARLLDAATDALKAEAIYRALMGAARVKAIRLLKEEALHPFAAALETGDFALHLGF